MNPSISHFILCPFFSFLPKLDALMPSSSMLFTPCLNPYMELATLQWLSPLLWKVVLKIIWNVSTRKCLSNQQKDWVTASSDSNMVIILLICKQIMFYNGHTKIVPLAFIDTL